ncbi:hypothetical protein MHYP_G00292080 [Metynnis hypsauchen]
MEQERAEGKHTRRSQRHLSDNRRSACRKAQTSADEVHRDGENHSGVPLCGDFTQGLQVPQLQSGWRLRHHIGCFLQSTGRFHLSLSCNHLYETST